MEIPFASYVCQMQAMSRKWTVDVCQKWGMSRKLTVGARLADSWTWLLQVYGVISVFWSHFPLQKPPWNGSKGKPLKEYRGERWFRVNWAAKHASKSSLCLFCGRIPGLPRQFGRVLTCKQSNRCRISLVGLGGRWWNGNRRRSTLTVWLRCQ